MEQRTTISFNPTTDEKQTIKALQYLQQTLTNRGLLYLPATSPDKEGFDTIPECRHIKVQQVYRQKLSNPFHSVPSLTLCGDWLNDAGFAYNKHVRIITLDQLLIVCPENLRQPARIRKLA